MSWPLVKLHDVCRPRQWKTISSSNLLEDGYPVYGANGKIGFYSEYTHEYPALIITCRGATCGNVHISEPKSYINGNAMALDDLDGERVDIRFLYYYLLGRGFDDVISGSAQPQITGQGLTKIEIPLPPLSEQKRIAAILDKADAIRRKRQQAIQLADDFLRAVFLDMFGDPVTNPKGWEVVPLRNHITFITSGGRGWSKYYSDSGARFIRSLDVQMNFIGDKDVAYVAPPDNAEAKRTKVECGDVLLTITGSRIGRVCVVPEKFETAFISQHVSLIRVDANLNPRYLSMFLSLGNGGQAQIAKAQYGQSKPGLNFEHIGDFKIPIPSKDEQNRFVDLWDKAIGISGRLAASEGYQMNLLNALSQKAFRGEL